MNRLVMICAAVALALLSHAQAQETPQRGGIFTQVAEGDPDNFDCHAAVVGLTMQYTAPEYSLLLRYDPANYPKIEGDTAVSWTISPDGLSYRFKLRPNIKFHDGSDFSAQDVKATYERLRNPPPGVISARKEDFGDITEINVLGPLEIEFKLSKPNPSMLGVFASPFNCLYSANKLAADPAFPAKNVMGTGPFQLVEYVAGASWTAKRFDGYFRAGQPYLDGIKLINIKGPAAVNAMSGGQVDANLMFISPTVRERIEAGRGDKVAFQSVQMDVLAMAVINTKRKPFDDVRVRRALALAVDRPTGEAALSKMTPLKGIGGLLRPGYDMALAPNELAMLPGFGPDIQTARTEARRLLAEAGVPNLSLKVLRRAGGNPFGPIAIFLIDQWRQIGITAEQTIAENAPYFANIRSGDFDVAVNSNVANSDDPTDTFPPFVPGAPINYSRSDDPILVDLFEKQKRSLDPLERKRLANDFEKRVISEAYVLPLFWNQRTVALDARVHGWHVTPVNQIGLDLGGVWLTQ